MSSLFDNMFGTHAHHLMNHFGESAKLSIVLRDETVAEDADAIFRNDSFQDEYDDAGRLYRRRTLEVDVFNDGMYAELDDQTLVNATDAYVLIGAGKYAGTKWRVDAISKRTDNYVRMTLIDKAVRAIHTTGYYRS